jgi:hypothetical protein
MSVTRLIFVSYESLHLIKVILQFLLNNKEFITQNMACIVMVLDFIHVMVKQNIAFDKI